MAPEHPMKFKFYIMPVNKVYWNTAIFICLRIVYGIV